MFKLNLTKEELWVIELALGAQKIALVKAMNPEADFETYKEAWDEYEKVVAMSNKTWAMLESAWRELI